MSMALSDFKSDQLLTPEEVAEILRKHRATITSMCASGELVAMRLGRQYRIKACDLEAYMKQQTLPYAKRPIIPRRERKK